MPTRWQTHNKNVVACDLCPRLREHCETVATEKRRAYQDDTYWGKPVPEFGDPKAKLLIVGLAPGAHGANRTGRMFTGDRSGDWLYRALYKAGFASQPESTGRRDGLRLIGAAITNAVHCAPPGNKPTTDEIKTCRAWYDNLIDFLQPKVFIALGGIAWNLILRHAKEQGAYSGKKPKFGHGTEFELLDNRWIIGSYHPSQQNTFTGRLTEPMFDSVFRAAKKRLK